MRDTKQTGSSGALIVNADDWGRDAQTTDRILDCALSKAVSSVSAMVFMKDSERAAEIAQEREIDVGLHLNFTTSFSADGLSAQLVKHQHRLSTFLQRHRFAPAVFHPGLMNAFKYVVAAQCDEFVRIYGTEPKRVDGHHHMHLCSNVLFGGLLPSRTIARRNFSFQPGEKSFLNRFYRSTADRVLARRHCMTDFFFSLEPLQPGRVQKIFSLANRFTVEVETHPVNADEYQFMQSGEIFRRAGEVKISNRYTLPRFVCA